MEPRLRYKLEDKRRLLKITPAIFIKVIKYLEQERWLLKPAAMVAPLDEEGLFS